MWRRIVEQDGTCRVRFWAEAEAGEPTLSVTADAANNEYEDGPPAVAVQEVQIDGFAGGHTFELSPFSMVALRWQAAP